MDEQDLINVLPPGTRLHSNEVLRVLGKGGFGITYLAQHSAFAERLSAIKEYFPLEFGYREGAEVRAKSSQHQRLFESGKDRFLEEARTLARFQHPNIVQVTDFFAANGTAYLVMVYEEGNPLSEIYRRAWRRGKGPDEAALLAVALPLLDGLEALHHGGIIHRDIKPGNIFLRKRDESPVLLDFGSARQAMGVQTKTLTAYLTPGYAPFEQYYSKSDSQGPWTDIYAMGAVLYHGVSGKPPAESTLRSSAMLRGEVDPMVSARELGQGRYSEKLLAAIDWSLALLERQRPQDCGEFVAALRGGEVFQSEGITEIRGAAATAAKPTPVQSPPYPAVSPSPLEGEGGEGSVGNARGEALSPSLQPSPVQGKGTKKTTSGTGTLAPRGGEDRAAAPGADLARNPTPGTDRAAQPPARKSAMGVFLGGMVAATVAVGGLAWWWVQQQTPAPVAGVQVAGKGDPTVGLPAGEAAGSEAATTKAVREETEKARRVEAQAKAEAEAARAEAAKALARAAETTKREAAKAAAAEKSASTPAAHTAEAALAAVLAMTEEAAGAEAEEKAKAGAAPGAEQPMKVFHDKSGRIFRDKLKDGSEGPWMVVIGGGTFQMGSPASEAGRFDNETQHQVKVGSFAMGAYEVTFAEYDLFARATGRKLPSDHDWGRGARPVIDVSWDDAMAYAKWLSEQTGKRYRLPTEAEWEYAARAGTQTAYWWGNEVGRNHANCDGCGSRRNNKQTAPVGSFERNGFGLYDILGNAWEWTCSVTSTYGSGEESRCNNTDMQARRVIRGGSWLNAPRGMRSASRGNTSPDDRSVNLGFRLAQDL
jgi:formylglycine-generating enzyme required for sulfatase activity